MPHHLNMASLLNEHMIFNTGQDTKSDRFVLLQDSMSSMINAA